LDKKYTYKAFGLVIQSAIQLPEMVEFIGNPDVYIAIGDIPKQLEGAVTKGINFETSETEFILKVDNVARYYVANGQNVIVEKFEGVDESEVRLFLLGSALAALIHQRGMLPLHGSAVNIAGKCIVFCGISGSGKSTLASALVNKGYTLLTDDICVISHTNNNMPVVLPGFPQVKLWKDSMEKLGAKTSLARKVRPNIEKYGLKVDANFCFDALPVSTVYILSPINTDKFEILPVKGIEKFNILKTNTYRLNFVKGVQSKNLFFSKVTAFATKVNVKKVSRPNAGFKINELVELIVNDVKTS
jgi:hypothetical protein